MPSFEHDPRNADPREAGAVVIQGPDAVNGIFEAFGAWSVWANVRRLHADREVKGIVWQFAIGFLLWGVWNCYYYRRLDQPLSWLAGLLLCAGNLVWAALAWRYKRGAP